MTGINETRPKGTTPDHLNFMAGPAWDVSNPIDRLRMCASSCFFGEPTYYQEASTEKPKGRGFRRYAHEWDYYVRSTLNSDQIRYLNETLGALDPQEWRELGAKERMESAIDAALDYDIGQTLRVAASLRQDDNIRTTPQVIMVRAANHPKAKGTGLIRLYGDEILRRADEPAVQLAYQLATYGKDAPVPHQLKKAWRHFLEGQSEYSLGKYRMESRIVKTVDVVNLVHPASPNIDKLVRGTLPTPKTWETMVSGAGSTPEAWADAFPQMGHMALLRNLRNLIQKSKVSQTVIAAKLVEGAPDGKQLPFRYWSAYQSVVNNDAEPILVDAIEDALRQSCERLHFPGRVMSLCDNSGSAWGSLTSEWGSVHVAEIANLTASLTAYAAEHGEVGVFGDGLETFSVPHRSSVFDTVKKANRLGGGVGGGTENGIWLFWDKAISEGTHYDAVFVYSDMQAGHGGLYGTNPDAYRAYQWSGGRASAYGRGSQYIDVPKLVATYRNKVNPEVEVFLVQVAGYQDTIMPEHYRHTHILGGWSDGILRYAQRYLVPQQ